MNKKESKFHFVSSEEMIANEKMTEETLEEDISFNNEYDKSGVEPALEEMQIVKDAKLDELKILDSLEDDENIPEFEFVNEEENVEEKVPKTTNNMNRIYIGFEARVITLVLVVLCLFFGACYFILEACNFSKDRIITYSENSEATYSVCVGGSDYYNDSCLGEGMEYLAAITNGIKVNFKYNVSFSNEIDYNLAYHVVAVTKIYDKNDHRKVFYENEYLLIEKTNISDFADEIFFDKDIEIDYKSYNDYVKGYQSKYGSDKEASLEIVLYLDEKSETRSIASLVMPLGGDSFGITKNVIANSDKDIELDNDVWNDYNAMCAVGASILIILALIVLFRVTSLVLKVTSNKSKYQLMLEKIMKEYDDLIVSTKDGYDINPLKQVIKVTSFKELVDARNTLGKPIIYSRINDVKSEFIVDDEDKVYKYVIKEAHFQD